MPALTILGFIYLELESLVNPQKSHSSEPAGMVQSAGNLGLAPAPGCQPHACG